MQYCMTLNSIIQSSQSFHQHLHFWYEKVKKIQNMCHIVLYKSIRFVKKLKNLSYLWAKQLPLQRWACAWRSNKFVRIMQLYVAYNFRFYLYSLSLSLTLIRTHTKKHRLIHKKIDEQGIYGILTHYFLSGAWNGHFRLCGWHPASSSTPGGWCYCHTRATWYQLYTFNHTTVPGRNSNHCCHPYCCNTNRPGCSSR